MYDLTAFQRDQLYVIAGLGDPRGVDIKAELDDYYTQEVQPGRLYPNLDVLAEKGLVSKEPINDRSNAYKPTERCLRAIEGRAEWESRYVERTGGEKPVPTEPTD